MAGLESDRLRNGCRCKRRLVRDGSHGGDDNDARLRILVVFGTIALGLEYWEFAQLGAQLRGLAGA